MKHKYYWLILCNPVIIGVYYIAMAEAYRLCQYGGVGRSLPIIAVCGGIGVLWALGWTFFWLFRKGRKEGTDGSGLSIDAESADCRNLSSAARWITRGALFLEFTAILGITFFYGYKIYQSAIPYQGRLYWFLEEKRSVTEVMLRHNNFLESGIEGILEDLDRKDDLPEELYAPNGFSVDFQADGTITSIFAFLYGEMENGERKAWLIEYDAETDSAMKVRLNSHVPDEEEPQDILTPMREMLDAFLQEGLWGQYADGGEESSDFISVRYRGYRSQTLSAPWYELGEDGSFTQHPVNYGAPLEGFQVSFSYGDTQLFTLASGVDTMQTKEEIASLEAQEKFLEEIQDGGMFLLDGDEIVYYLREDYSMKLRVVDAALGSRFYSFEAPGVSNPDPFQGSAGVAEGILFLDEKTGFILLRNASADHSDLYYTEDGGENFVPVSLPVEEGEKDLTGNEFGFTSNDFDYVGIPYIEDGTLYVKVGTEEADVDNHYLFFRSQDGGKSWNYQGYACFY